MAFESPKPITAQFIASRDALDRLCQSLNGLPNNPASLYLSTTPRSLIIYVLPTQSVNVISLQLIVQALHHREKCAFVLKSLLETGAATKVFFDARKPAKILFDSCGIRLSVPPCIERSHVHEVQVMEIALRQSDYDREWLAGLDRCIAQDSSLDVNVLILDGPGRNNNLDKRILHLPILWKKYHDRLLANRNGIGGSFWVSQIREATRKRLEVSCGAIHRGYSIEGARSSWSKESIDEQTESWNDDVMMDCHTGGELLGGAEHWDKFKVL